MQTRYDQYKPVNTFSRSPQIPQIISYILVSSLTIVFFAAVQGNYQSQSTRIALITVFMIDLCILVVSCLYCSKIDPADPLMLNYRNGDRK